MTNSKQKWRRIVGIAITVLLLIPFIYLGVAYCADKLKYKRIEKYYQADTENFDSM
ncbi:MAG: hypothetical protein ACI4QX_04860 [Lachnospiraceae bacterium]